jgi:hypothetical protein
MKPRTFKPKEGPEAKIQREVIAMLRNKGWFVKETHGNMYQSGFPDLYATHSLYGSRWIEIKNPEHYSFTAAQLDDFPKFSANGSRIWILTAATEFEYRKLFQPENWSYYLMNFRGL